MRIGIIGSGTMGRTLGKLLAAIGYDVLFGSHDSQRVGGWIESEKINERSGTYSDAAEFGDNIFLVTLWQDTKTAIEEAGSLKGKILIDRTNPEDPNNNYQHVIGLNTSGAQKIASWAEGAKVVKAFNHIYGSMLEASPQFGSQNASIFYCGDDLEAKKIVAEIVVRLGLDPVDAGDLRSARFIEPLAALWVHLADEMKYGGENIALKFS